MQIGPDTPVVIEARSLEKSFRLPYERMDTLKERALHPMARRRARTLHALRDVSFDVHRGEFFGIVGRNGSGKSTLLKLMASIYRIDSGRIRMAGTLAPFIELGVGFNLELSSRENIVLNGVMMGLTRREARRRVDAVLDFAELREFADLRLKNYSSGMLVRLAFAAMVEAGADIMLVDEVLAVGDAAFAQKCMDFFRARRAAGRTLVLVTHDMSAVQSLCDRAMLLHDGRMRYIGDPEEAALRYYRLNFAGHAGVPADGGAVPDVNVRVRDVWLEDREGRRVENVEQGEPLALHALFEAVHDLERPVFGFHFVNVDGVPVFGCNAELDDGSGEPGRVAAGRRVRVSARLENPLLPGRYSVSCMISRNRTQGDLALHVVRLLDFLVYGTRPGPGVVTVEGDVSAEIEPEVAPWA